VSADSGGRRIWQKKPFTVGCLIIIGLVVIFAVILSLLAKKTITAPEIETPSAFSFGSKVAIVKIEGVITDSERIIRQLRYYRKNRSVKAIVLRVNSPGGAVAPAQEIYEEIKRFRRQKPVVCSMGTVAASGGYYVCLPCNYIISAPGTVTGSIGVLMQITDLEELLRWMKIRHQVIKSGKFKDAGSPYRALTDEERTYFQSVINNVHEQFKKAIAESRGLSKEQIEKIADGRIFTGEQALKLGLVDELGNLEDAIKKAGELAGIKGEPQVIFPKRRFGIFEQWGSRLAEALFNKLFELASSPIWYLEPGGLYQPQTRSEK